MNWNELLLFVAGHFLDKVIELLIQQLKNNNDRERVKALFVITHLVNSSENLIRTKITTLVTALRSMLGEHNVKVKEGVMLWQNLLNNLVFVLNYKMLISKLC